MRSPSPIATHEKATGSRLSVTLGGVAVFWLLSTCALDSGDNIADPGAVWLSVMASGSGALSPSKVAHGRRDRCGDVISTDEPPLRAIERLATTDREVRVLVFGQSISEQAWWLRARAFLEQTYPAGKLVMEEHALGGCAAQCLIGREAWEIDGSRYNRLPEQVFAFKPDLIIFHVYGDHVDYSYILKGFRDGCSAFDDYESSDGQDVPSVHCTDAQRALSEGYRAPEVLVQNDFVAADVPVLCASTPTPRDFACFMNERQIPELVQRYGYVLQDNFHLWPIHIAEHGIDPASLLQPDMTHLSEPVGTDVMFAITAPHLCYRPAAR